MQHLDEGTIHAWLDGALDAAESSRVERHVAECKTCSEVVAEARGMIAGASRIVSSLDVVPGNVIPRSSGKAAPRGWLWRSLRLTPGRAALAATLLLAVGTMLTVQHAPNGAPDASSAMPMKRSVEAPAPAAAPEPAMLKPTAQAPAMGGAPSIAMRDAKTPPVQNVPAIRSDTAVARASAPRASGLATSGFAAPTTAPATSATQAAKAAEKTQPGVPLSAVVTTSSAEARGRDSANSDAAKQVTANAADSIRAGAVPAARARQFSAAQSAGRGAMAAAGALSNVNESGECYRLNSDSAAAGQAGAFVPRRFFLQQSAGSPPQNVVRAVLPNGRIDSAIAGARWERLSPTTTTLYLTRAASESAPTLTLHFADGRVAGQLSTPAGSQNVDIVRWNCRP